MTWQWVVLILGVILILALTFVALGFQMSKHDQT